MVTKGKPGRKKKVSHPAAVVPAIPEGMTSETYLEQVKTIQSEWKKGKKRLHPPERADGVNVSNAKTRNPHSKCLGLETSPGFPYFWQQF